MVDTHMHEVTRQEGQCKGRESGPIRVYVRGTLKFPPGEGGDTIRVGVGEFEVAEGKARGVQVVSRRVVSRPRW